MVPDFVYFVVAGLVLFGTVFTLLATIGLLRLPDIFTRMHAASKAGAVGAGLLLLATALASWDIGVAIRATLGIAFILLTTPLSAHLLARAAFRNGQRPLGAVPVDKDSTGTGAP